MSIQASNTNLDLQNKAARHADSLRPLGEVFSGVSFTGHAVDLKVHAKFDAEGRVRCAYTGSSEGMLILVHKHNPSYEDHELCTREAYTQEYQRPWEKHVSAAWGLAKFQQVCGVLMLHYRDRERYSYALPPTCKELGVKSGGFEQIQEEIFETSMRGQVPGLLAISGYLVATTQLTIEGAVNLINKLLKETHMMDGRNNYKTVACVAEMEIHHIHPDLCELALAIIHDFGEKEAYKKVRAMTTGWANTILANHPFFTKEMMARCF